VIKRGAMFGFVGVGDVFAQVVDADARARLVDPLGDADDVAELGPGDEAAGEAQPERRVLGKMADGMVLREFDEDGSQHEASAGRNGRGVALKRIRVWRIRILGKLTKLLMIALGRVLGQTVPSWGSISLSYRLSRPPVSGSGDDLRA